MTPLNHWGVETSGANQGMALLRRAFLQSGGKRGISQIAMMLSFVCNQTSRMTSQRFLREPLQVMSHQ